MNLWVKKYTALFLGLGLLVGAQQPAFAITLEEEMVLAALTLNIVRFTTWPEKTPSGNDESLGLCVVGNNMVQQSFASLDHKKVGNKTLKVINLSRLNNFEQCHALYISKLKKNILLQVFVEIKESSLLTIGRGGDFAEMGGMVGLEKINNKMTLHVNVPKVREANLNISARLLSLAKIHQ